MTKIDAIRFIMAKNNVSYAVAEVYVREVLGL